MTADDVKMFDFVFLILPVKYNVVDDKFQEGRAPSVNILEKFDGPLDFVCIFAF